MRPGTKCTVHLNLHRRRQGLPHWSVTVGGRVVANVTDIVLVDAVPVVSDATFRRIKASTTQARKVYAKVRGFIAEPGTVGNGVEVHCNPHRCRDFTLPDGSVWSGSKVAEFHNDGFFTC